MKLQKENIPFTMVANEVLYRRDLSWKAKGLYAYLFSKPEGWEFSGDRIVKEGSDGRKVIYAALKELEQAELLERTRQPDGKMDYLLKYSNKQIDMENRTEPLALFGQEPKRPMTKRGSISNKDGESNKDIATGVAKEFSLAEEIKKMEDSPRRDINIIALYLDIKKPDLKNKDQLSVAIKRHLRPAQALKVFTDDQILRGVDKAKKLTSEWTIETVAKCLTK